MILSTDDRIWRRIYYNIRDHIMDSESWSDRDGSSTTEKLKAAFEEMGIRLFRDESVLNRQSGNWTHVYIPDDDIMMLLLRWG